jgi:hypothetical protein
LQEIKHLLNKKEWSGETKPKGEEAYVLGAVIQHTQPGQLYDESRVLGFVG